MDVEEVWQKSTSEYVLVMVFEVMGCKGSIAARRESVVAASLAAAEPKACSGIVRIGCTGATNKDHSEFGNFTAIPA